MRDLITIDPTAPRLMMPKSGKGGTRNPGQRKIERYSVSISPQLAALLKAAAKGRPSNAPLLMRTSDKPWNENDPCADYRRSVRSIVEKIGLDPDVYGLYAFRHTSITRMLLKGTHTSIVAKTHDTSEAMIRRHYAASILDCTDEITRKTLPRSGQRERLLRATSYRWRGDNQAASARCRALLRSPHDEVFNLDGSILLYDVYVDGRWMGSRRTFPSARGCNGCSDDQGRDH